MANPNWSSYISITHSSNTRYGLGWSISNPSNSEYITVTLTTKLQLSKAGYSSTRIRYVTYTPTIGTSSGKKAIDSGALKKYTATSDNQIWNIHSYQIKIKKTTSAQSLKITAKVDYSGNGATSGSRSITTDTITIPALQKFTITYDANGGSGTIANQIKYYSKSVTLNKGTNFSRPYYKLGKWNTKADGTGTNYSLGATYNNNSNLNLYAIWAENPTIVKSTMTINSFRTNSTSSTEEEDIGTYGYFNIKYTPTLKTSDTVTNQQIPATIKIYKNNDLINTIETQADTDTYEYWDTGLEIEQKYNYRIELVDQYNTLTKEITISTANILVDVSPDGLSMGIMHVAVEGQQLTTGNLYVDGEMSFFPIGSGYITRTNENPASYLGGQWELVDKDFIQQGTASDATWFTKNTTNCSSCNITRMTASKQATLRIELTPKIALVPDKKIQLGTLNFSAMGLEGVLYTRKMLGMSYEGNGFCEIEITNEGIVSCLEVISHNSTNSILAEKVVYIEYQPYCNMLRVSDSLCDKFYWKRIA